MPDASFWIQWLLFIPLFVVINLIAAVPGRDDLKDAVRVGLRHAGHERSARASDASLTGGARRSGVLSTPQQN